MFHRKVCCYALVAFVSCVLDPCSNCSTYASSLLQVLMYLVPISPSSGELVMHKRSALCIVAMYMVTLSLGNVCMFINYLNLQAQIC